MFWRALLRHNSFIMLDLHHTPSNGPCMVLVCDTMDSPACHDTSRQQPRFALLFGASSPKLASLISAPEQRRHSMATSIIGKGERRVDALGKVTGRAKFAADYNAGHQLYGKVLRSAYPHARILGIDTAKARQVEGVEAMLTARDIPGEKVIGIVVKNQAILVVDKVR